MPRARRLALPLVVLALLVGAPAARGSNDPAFRQQWALSQIGAPAAWATSTGAGVTIGIVDTGIDLSHDDLAGRVVAHTDCLGSGGDPNRCAGSGQDPHGHGTHVAGIAAAAKDNRHGVAGVAPDARLVVARVLGADGAGKTSDATAGIKWVVDHGARVVNLSFGDEGLVALSGTSLREGVDYAWSRGAIPVLAAGNTNLLGLGLVGGGDYRGLKAVVVGATTRSGAVAGYSSPLRSATWALVAPGGSGGPSPEQGVVSTWRANQYAVLSGTSMAAPHVAGALAVLLGSGLSRDEAVQRMLDTADSSVGCGASCRGRLDLARAVGPPSPKPAPSGVSAASMPGRTARPGTASPPAPVPIPTTVPPLPPSTPAAQPHSEAAAAAGPADGGDEPSVVAPGVVAGLLVLAVGGATTLAAWRRRLELLR